MNASATPQGLPGQPHIAYAGDQLMVEGVRLSDLAREHGTLLIDVNAGGQQVYYGEYIEDGTRHIRPYKFMANALEFVVENIAPKIFEDALVDALDEALGGGL